MMLALKHSKINPVIVRNEQAASFMACGYAIYSGRLGFHIGVIGTQRATVWEVHPITRIETQDSGGNWQNVEGSQ